MKIVQGIILAGLSVVLAGVLGYQKITQPETTPIVVNQPNNQSRILKEGETADPTMVNTLSCSDLNLNMIPDMSEYDSNCQTGEIMGNKVTCTYCGNEVCGKGENKCNCPQDCGNAFVVQSISANLSETDSEGQFIKVKFNHEVDPKTITKKTVIIYCPKESLDDSGGLNFVGSLSYDSSSNILTIIPQPLIKPSISCSWYLRIDEITGKDGRTFVGQRFFFLTPYIK